MSTEPTTSTPSTRQAAEPCRSCGAPLADDQRYCLECGERVAPLNGAPASSAAPGPPVGAQAGAPAPAAAPATDPQSSALTVLAGVGVLLLAMGIGVLIGRSGSGKSAPAPAAQVITVGATPAAAAQAQGGGEAAFSGDWPAAKSGYTVQLQTLPVAGTSVSAVEAAKSAASGKGASHVGALKSEEFRGLPAGRYVIYSGKYTNKSEAQKALTALERRFPGAKVIHVSPGGAASASEPHESTAESNAVGHSLSRPAPPSTLKSLSHAKGKSYEEQSKNLPDVISTG